MQDSGAGRSTHDFWENPELFKSIESFNKTVRFKGEPIAPLPCDPSKSIDDTTCINIRFASLALTLSQLLVTLCALRCKSGQNFFSL